MKKCYNFLVFFYTYIFSRIKREKIGICQIFPMYFLKFVALSRTSKWRGFCSIYGTSLIQADGQFSRVSGKCCLASVLFMMSHPIDSCDWWIARDSSCKWPTVILTIPILSDVLQLLLLERKRIDLSLSARAHARTVASIRMENEM